MKDVKGNDLAIGDYVAVARVGTLSYANLETGYINEFNQRYNGKNDLGEDCWSEYAMIQKECGTNWFLVYEPSAILKL